MTSIYIASSVKNWQKVRGWMKTARDLKYWVTYDWTQDVEKFNGKDATDPEECRRHAFADLCGISEADLLIALYHPEVHGTLIEIGYALAHGIPVVLVDWKRPSPFYELPQVVKVREEDLVNHLAFS